MNEMIDKVALALAEHTHRDGDYGMQGIDAYEKRPDEFRAFAHAAVTPLRDPTLEMIVAATDKLARLEGNQWSHNYQVLIALTVFRAMIGAILTPSPSPSPAVEGTK